MPSAYRARGLGNWGFNCSCSLCSSTPAETAASDWRRERLVELYHAGLQEASDYEELVELTREFVGIVEKERLIPKVGEYYQFFMRLYYDYGDIESAYKYGEVALVFSETFSDPDAGYCTGLREDLEVLKKLMDEMPKD